jgi:hypothetical protein
MTELRAMKAVYCYFFPEVRPLLHEVESKVPDDLFLVTTPAEEVHKSLESLFSPALDVPATPKGCVDLDEIHIPIIERIVRAYSHLVPALAGFKYSYPTPGSSEGIFKLLTKLKVDGCEAINVLDGEYEGYGEYAGPEDLKMRVNTVNPEKTDPAKLEPAVWFISNPSARDGNIIQNKFIQGSVKRATKLFWTWRTAAQPSHTSSM